MLKIEKHNCCGCGSCALSCPKNCISMQEDAEGFLYPLINAATCINCGLCEKKCPILSKEEPESRTSLPKTFAVINKDEYIRSESSSGGVFTLLAEEILSREGIVYGASFSEDFKSVQHIFVEKSEDLKNLRGSKYLQSNIGNTYKQTKIFLEEGRPVLFSGTPCQIAGLYTFLGKQFDNLYTADFICHGVPSPLVWRKYVDFRNSRVSSQPYEVSFKHKNPSWQKYSLKFVFRNNKKYIKNIFDDLYLQGFLSDLFLRPSCYNCHFKGLARPSDISLADFWGIEKINPNMDDKKGTSLLFINSLKGTDLFDSIKEKTIYEPTNLHEAVSYNGAAVSSASLPKERGAFFEFFQVNSISKTLKTFCLPPLKVRIKRKLYFIKEKLKNSLFK
ncbi:MAG: Coenzyme F420 hydrogenase/dehydrogenase, beta subunit C-terminal domain [Clostridia bacterium]|nr:Coenzyme F420 hydrogenase/dehydrogenase, beta subunit C-terminal domain [Clostridia bacterium]